MFPPDLMPLFVSDPYTPFPPVHLADEEGLLAFGGDLSTHRLLSAYRQGIFPWYDEPPILWWCPNPRFVLLPQQLRISKSIKPLLNRNAFDFTVNQSFAEVIRHCKLMPRAGQFGTWITDEVEQAYIQLYRLGFAHSAEVWQNGQLAGGLYGVRLGRVFFGESMFSRVSSASRYAFIKYIQLLQTEGVELVDCQVYTPYLESFGAQMIPREEFSGLLKKLIE